MSNTRKPYETEHDALCDRLCNPAPKDDSGPSYHTVTVIYRQPKLIHHMTWGMLAFLSGCLWGGLWFTGRMIGSFF